jgi:hypothetical protein
MASHYVELSYAFQTAAVAALILAVCALLPKLKHYSKLSKLPVLGGSASGEKQRQKFMASAKEMYMDGYTKVSLLVMQGVTTTHACVVQELCIPHSII